VASRRAPQGVLRLGSFVVTGGARRVCENPQGLAAERGTDALSGRPGTPAPHGGLAGGAGEPVTGVFPMAMNDRRSGTPADSGCVWGIGR
jgi:hypothetical protein